MNPDHCRSPAIPFYRANIDSVPGSNRSDADFAPFDLTWGAQLEQTGAVGLHNQQIAVDLKLK